MVVAGGMVAFRHGGVGRLGAVLSREARRNGGRLENGPVWWCPELARRSARDPPALLGEVRLDRIKPAARHRAGAHAPRLGSLRHELIRAAEFAWAARRPQYGHDGRPRFSMPPHGPGELTGDSEPEVAPGRRCAMTAPVQTYAVEDPHDVRLVSLPRLPADVDGY
jgi:hypothetical protein